MSKSFIVKGNIIYSESSSKLKCVENGYIVVVDGHSRGVFNSIPDEYKDIEVFDYKDNLIIPGLVDLHLHAPQFAFRGTNMDLELMDWLNTYTFPEEARYKDIDYAELSYSMFAEYMKKSATTRCVVFATIHRRATELLMEKMEDTGLMSYVGKVNMDRESPSFLREESARIAALDTLEWLENTSTRFERTKPILTPRFIPSCSDELLERLGQIRENYKLCVQSHLSENYGEIETVKKLAPDAAFYGDAYDKYGLFGGENAPCIMAHCVYSSKEEIALMKKNGVTIAHCPESNMNLASGISPIRKYMNEGLKIGLGSDVAGGTTESMFRIMVEAIQVSKLYWRLVNQDDKPLSFSEAFYLATLGGGSFFGKVGSFDSDFEFDALVLDDSDLPYPHTLSPLERLERFSYLSGDKTGIKSKWVKGSKIF